MLLYFQDTVDKRYDDTLEELLDLETLLSRPDNKNRKSPHLHDLVKPF